MAPPTGVEPAHVASEATALSTELRGRVFFFIIILHKLIIVNKFSQEVSKLTGKVFAVIALFSTVSAIINGRVEQLSSTVISECESAVSLALMLLGTMSFWSGIMNVAKQSGLVEKFSRLLKPLICKIFKGVDKNPPALEYISLNMTANMLGLGNVATPMGIEAVRALNTQNKLKDTASDNMVMLVVLNTASIQLLPTTVAMLRLKYGAQNPMDVLPAILLASFASVVLAIISVKVVNRIKKGAG